MKHMVSNFMCNCKSLPIYMMATINYNVFLLI